MGLISRSPGRPGSRKGSQTKAGFIVGFFYIIMFHVYFLYSEKFDKFYVGHSDDPERRLSEHNHNDNPTFTSKYRPWTLAWHFPVSENRGEAIKIEKFIKRQKSRKLIERIINEKLTLYDFIHVVKK